MAAPATILAYAPILRILADFIDPPIFEYPILIQYNPDGTVTYILEIGTSIPLTEAQWSINIPSIFNLNVSPDKMSCVLTPIDQISNDIFTLTVTVTLQDGTNISGSVDFVYISSVPVPIPPPPPPPPPPLTITSVSFIKADMTTQGTWTQDPNASVPGANNTYLVDGGYVGGLDVPRYPSYCTFAYLPANPYRDSANANPNAPIDPNNINASRSKQFIYSSTNIILNFPITDGLNHQLALYFWDWQQPPTILQVQIIDGDTNAVLDTQAVSNFSDQGIWLIWNINGHVKAIISKISGTGFNFVNAISLGPVSKQ